MESLAGALLSATFVLSFRSFLFSVECSLASIVFMEVLVDLLLLDTDRALVDSIAALMSPSFLPVVDPSSFSPRARDLDLELPLPSLPRDLDRATRDRDLLLPVVASSGVLDLMESRKRPRELDRVLVLVLLSSVSKVFFESRSLPTELERFVDRELDLARVLVSSSPPSPSLALYFPRDRLRVELFLSSVRVLELLRLGSLPFRLLFLGICDDFSSASGIFPSLRSVTSRPCEATLMTGFSPDPDMSLTDLMDVEGISESAADCPAFIVVALSFLTFVFFTSPFTALVILFFLVDDLESLRSA